MSVHAGRYGLVNGQSTTRQWSINDNHTPAEAVAGNTAFGKIRRPGVRDWAGSFAFFGNTPFVFPGQSFTFQGYTAPENDAGGAGVTYSGTAFGTQLTINWNFTGGELINAQLDFVGHLGLATAQTAPPLDASVPVLEPIAAGKVQVSTDGGTTFTDLLNVSTATFTLMNSVQEYVNSSTVVSGVLWKGRKQGIVDWSLSVNQQDNLRTPFNIGDQVALKLWVDGSTFWLLKFAIVKDFTGIQINRETGAIIAQTINFEMDAAKASDGTLGTITTPGGTVLWPIAQS